MGGVRYVTLCAFGGYQKTPPVIFAKIIFADSLQLPVCNYLLCNKKNKFTLQLSQNAKMTLGLLGWQYDSDLAIASCASRVSVFIPALLYCVVMVLICLGSRNASSQLGLKTFRDDYAKRNIQSCFNTYRIAKWDSLSRFIIYVV